MPPEPAVTFPWSDEDGPREIFLYVLREGPLADDGAVTQLIAAAQDEASHVDSLLALESGMGALAQEHGLRVYFLAGPDHSDPLGERVSVGFRPRGPEKKPLSAWG